MFELKRILTYISVLIYPLIIHEVMSMLSNEKTFIISIKGNVKSIKAHVCNIIIVQGKVGQVQTHAGNVKCQDVTSSVTTVSGNVYYKKSGSIQTLCGDINQNIRIIDVN